MTTNTATGADATAAADLLHQRDQTARAADAIDRDPGEALDTLQQAGLQVSPNVGEVTPADMFRLFMQMQEQMGRMQTQLMELMGRPVTVQGQQPTNANLAKELELDRVQREATFEAWKTEPKDAVWIQPDMDEEKVRSAAGKFPPRMFRINGIEFPVPVGEMVMVPVSVAELVRWTQSGGRMQGPPQHFTKFADPARAPFLAGGNEMTVGAPGRSGEGWITPDGPPEPQPLGVKYDAYGH